MSILRTIVVANGELEQEDFAQIKEVVDIVTEEEMDKFVTELAPARGATPGEILRNTFIPVDEELSVLPTQRRLFTTTKRKQSRLFQELDVDAESSEEDTRKAKGKQHSQAELPHVGVDTWTFTERSKERVAVLYTGAQALPVFDEEIAQLLGQFHNFIIAETGSNASLDATATMLVITSNAVLGTDSSVLLLKVPRAEKSAGAIYDCEPLNDYKAAKNLVKKAAQFYDEKGYLQTRYRIPQLFQITGLKYAECVHIKPSGV